MIANLLLKHATKRCTLRNQAVLCKTPTLTSTWSWTSLASSRPSIRSLLNAPNLVHSNGKRAGFGPIQYRGLCCGASKPLPATATQELVSSPIGFFSLAEAFERLGHRYITRVQVPEKCRFGDSYEKTLELGPSLPQRIEAMNRNARVPKKPNHGKRPCSHHGRWMRRKTRKSWKRVKL